jgi:hypothetical protein
MTTATGDMSMTHGTRTLRDMPMLATVGTPCDMPTLAGVDTLGAVTFDESSTGATGGRGALFAPTIHSE